ncbi:ATP-dependent RNA helicase DHX33 [Geodia barretti]|uniref:RNA helicase n=1 Tax=Geodia barretti TaxID=519541 RepID=A0AA35XLG1_GEOBA|nr:ATP-dependent RNA helicase DHX33 [Geodia barretti]
MAADLQKWRRSLPIFPARGKLLKEIKARPSCVVVGETGSGKTTQIPQYLLESGVGTSGVVAVTQPRRVAAVSVAKRVAEERGCQLGSEVGYAVRFDECYSSETRLKYMTDGMLLREAMSDPTLSRYSTVILDEAHERTVHTDLLFGVVKAAQGKRRGDLRVVVMSATLAAEEFSLYFNQAKVLYVQGRQFPVEVLYAAEPQQDYLHSAVVSILQLHCSMGPGDILVFLTGREEIESVQGVLRECQSMFPSNWQGIHVQPLYAALPSHHQQQVFKPAPQGCRKVILSTNIAETSVTIPGVRCVVDPGLVKARGYSPVVGLDILSVQPISQAQARQRAGRAGREAPGSCYRLYTEHTFSQLRENSEPEILRCTLTSVVLELLAMGMSDLLTFDFMTAPSEEGLVSALEQLCLLGAVEGREGKEGVRLTALGGKMATFPLEPGLSRAILQSSERGCSEEVVCVAALLSVDSVFLTPPSLRDKMAAAHPQVPLPSWRSPDSTGRVPCLHSCLWEEGLVQGKLHPSAKPASCIGCSTTVGRAEQ